MARESQEPGALPSQRKFGSNSAQSERVCRREDTYAAWACLADKLAGEGERTGSLSPLGVAEGYTGKSCKAGTH
jgi:hypothetical protein